MAMDPFNKITRSGISDITLDSFTNCIDTLIKSKDISESNSTKTFESKSNRVSKLFQQIRDEFNETYEIDASTMSEIFNDFDKIERYYKDLKVLDECRGNLNKLLEKGERLMIYGQMKYGNILYELLEIICDVFKLDVLELVQKDIKHHNRVQQSSDDFSVKRIVNHDESKYKIEYQVHADGRGVYDSFILNVEYIGPSRTKDITDFVLDFF